jgi:hypothetical protein
MVDLISKLYFAYLFKTRTRAFLNTANQEDEAMLVPMEALPDDISADSGDAVLITKASSAEYVPAPVYGPEPDPPPYVWLPPMFLLTAIIALVLLIVGILIYTKKKMLSLKKKLLIVLAVFVGWAIVCFAIIMLLQPY